MVYADISIDQLLMSATKPYLFTCATFHLFIFCIKFEIEFTLRLPFRLVSSAWWRGVSDGTHAQDVRQRVRRSSGRGQETPYRHFRFRGPEVVAVSSHGPTEVGRQQRGQADRPHEQLCQGLRVPLPRWEHRDLRVRTRAWEYELQQNIFPDEAMVRVKSNNFQNLI